MTADPSTNPFQPVDSPQVDIVPKKQSFTLVEFFVVVGIIGVIVGFLLPATRAVPDAGRRMHCSNNLKQIGLALINYHSTYDSLPPAYTVDSNGRRLHSWRTLILPFLEQQQLYEKIDLSKPWNDPVNTEAIGNSIPPVYICPSNSQSPTKTLYQAVVDPISCFTGDMPVSFKEFADGTENTLMVYETTPAHGVEWMSPEDSDLIALTAIDKKSRTTHRRVFNAVFADGYIRAIAVDSPAEQRRGAVTIAGNDKSFTND